MEHDLSAEGIAPPPDHATAATWQRASLHLRGAYFGYFAAVGTFSPFAALYYRELDFSGFQVGVLTALPALGSAVFGPFLGALADSRSLHRFILRLALVCAAILAFAMSGVTTFPLVFGIMVLLALATVPVPPLMDSYGMTIAEQTGRSYGGLRVWGSVGYMALTLILGRVMGSNVSAILLVAYGICLGLTALASWGLPRLTDRHPQPLMAGLSDALHNRKLVLLLTVSYILSSSAAVMYTFLGIHMKELGGSTTLIGVAFAVSAASELPIIAFGSTLIARLGAVRLMTIGITIYALRMIALSLIQVPEWIVPLQLLHGLTYGAFLISSVTLAYRIGGRQHAATAQALLSAMSFGFGSITGALIGGTMLDSVGTVAMFRAAAVMMTLALVILIVGNRLIGLEPDPDPTTL